MFEGFRRGCRFKGGWEFRGIRGLGLGVFGKGAVEVFEGLDEIGSSRGFGKFGGVGVWGFEIS